MIPIFKTVIPPAAIERVAQTLSAGWLSEGQQVKAFEDAVCRKFLLPRALALNSGTAALHLAVLAAGVTAESEVITTAQTFIATAMAIMYSGGKPVFADIQPGTSVIDPKDIERRITARTKAIIVVHYGGYPCDMDEINAVARRHNLTVIEDAAHSLGVVYRGKPVGTLGDLAIFSFQAIKQLTTGDGGMLVCRKQEDHEIAYRQRWFGIDRANRQPSEIGQPLWDISELGYKYHMNEIAASLGLAQLEYFDSASARRKELGRLYRSELGQLDGLQLLIEKTDRENAFWLFTVMVERRLDFIRALRSRHVDAAVWHQRVDRNTLLGGLRDDLPNQARFDECQVSIPLRDSLTPEEVSIIIAAVKKGW